MLKKILKKLLKFIKKILSIRGVGTTIRNVRKWPKRQQFVDVSQILNWVDNINQGWIIITSKNKILFINKQAKKLLSIKKDSKILGKSLFKLEIPDEIKREIQKLNRAKTFKSIPYFFHEKELEISLMPGSKSTTLILLTNKRSLDYQRQLQERMLGDAAHELKTPLTALMLLGDRLEDLVKKKDRPLIKRLRKEILRLKLMVNDLLELSRLVNSSSVQDELTKTINMEEIVLSSWNTLKPLADKKKLNLVNTSKTNSLIEGNSEKLYRVVFNLLDNAIRYSPDSANINTQIHEDDKHLILSIKDEGPGLSKDDLKNMFQRFYRGDPSRYKNKRIGSGLGLSIAQQIVVNHKGAIEASNDTNGGTLMKIKLPLQKQIV
ncbi:two-component sensor histidine kinase, phosphate sensing [Prochlorococcus marinus str. NATL1A]|uniref:histidine kinase n=1 Tax=Prochlorococcus marinus (strain NATL1A) TaxID=167555 RepID=Q0GPQ1_PROM1|nr:PAS domain-containing sensor histidine kinase [Prochlorococcus marinus]ABI23446.1 two-component sensor histidine kinase [Prochlorococcus marinus str. NATL1A]ABM75706.1 two-component sensor histidine kinase, phosphate sensing [Prochlorococcus marinus str. NATL1A]